MNLARAPLPVTLKQAGAHLGVKADTLRGQAYDERGVGHRLGARKITARMWAVDAARLNVECARRGRPQHGEQSCQTCIDAGCPNG